MEWLCLKNVSFSYPGADTPALKDVSLCVNQGEFVTICGATGSGKSTLLRLLKPEMDHNGARAGQITCMGDSIDRIPPEQIGYVMQDTMGQIVTDKVWHELAFGLENLGADQAYIARRVAEMAAYFGIESWYERSTHSLSGGQAQLLNLASVMVMDPKILVLDEPTSQLDPIAAETFLQTIRRLNRELGLTVIITEHRLQDLIPVSDRLVILENGSILLDDEPRRAAESLPHDSPLLPYMPAAVQLYHRTGSIGACPLTPREGRAYLTQNFSGDIRCCDTPSAEHSDRIALSYKDVSYRYERHDPDALSGLTMQIYEGEIFAMVGANGAGKSTALLCAAGLLHPYKGHIRIFDKPLAAYKGASLYSDGVSMLPQDVNTVFLHDSVERELRDCKEGESLLPFDLRALYPRHPYDLSGGERQLVALARALSNRPRLLLLDEPTKGLDAAAKIQLAQVIRSLRDGGMTVVLVTHDVEFAAVIADRTAMMFRGACVSSAPTRAFFADNTFYTTAVCRMTRGIYEQTVTLDDLGCVLERSQRRVNV